MKATYLRFILLSAVVLLFAPAARAVTGLPDILSVEFSGPGMSARVTRWNIDSPGLTYSAPSGLVGLSGMARDASSRVLVSRCDCGGSFTGPPALFELNPSNGALQLVSQTSGALARLGGITGLADGRLVGYDWDLYKMVLVDPNTMSATQLTMTPADMLPDQFAKSPSGQVYAWASGSDGAGLIASKLYTVNTSTGAMTLIGGLSGLSVSANLGDMAFAADGRLIAITDANAGQSGGVLLPNSAYQINLQTGIPTFLASVGSVANIIRGFEFVTVPEPSSVIYIVTLLAVLGVRRR